MSRTAAPLLALVACVALAAAAHGATTPRQAGGPGTLGVTIKGSTVVRLDRALFTRISASEGAVRAGRPATATLTGVKFKVSKIATGADGTTYLIKHRGSMRISTPLRSVALANPTASISGVTGEGALTATIKGRRATVARLQIDIGSLEQTGSGLVADNVALTMTSRLAKELNRVLRVDDLASGAVLGKASIRVVTEQ